MQRSDEVKTKILTSLLLPINGLLVLSAIIFPSVCQHVSRPSQKNDNSQHWLSSPRAPSLCAQAFDGLEGTSIKGFTLDRAFAVTTPGFKFRTPTDSLLNNGHSNTHCHFKKYAHHHRSEKVKSYIETLSMKDGMFDKKSRPGSAFKIFKPVPRSKRCKENMLTPQGVAQSIQLGEYLAKSYANTLDSISSLTQELRDFAHTVGNELLYQSIYAVLYGLLGEKQFVYAGVGKLSHHFTDDNSNVEVQEHLDYFINKSFQDEHHLFKDQSSPTSDRWRITSEFGSGISAKDILSFVSLTHCDKPKKGKDVYMPQDLIESILSVSDTHNEYLLNSSIFQNYSKSTTLPFRKFIKSWILSSHNSRGTDFKLVSVDELLMLSLLAALDQSSIEHIPPVSRLVIERFHFQNSPPTRLKPSTSVITRSDVLSSPLLLQDSSHASFSRDVASHSKMHDLSGESTDVTADPKNTYFRVLYNGRVITSKLWNCRSDSLVSLGLCSLPRFALSLEYESQEKVDGNDFRDEL